MNLFQRLFKLKKVEVVFLSNPDAEFDKKTFVENELYVDIEERFKNTIDLLEKFKKKAFIPVTKSNENSFSACSKFGGLPYLASKDTWAKCPTCQKQMLLLFQLNLSELPFDLIKKNTVVQFFHCDEHFKTLIRKVELNGESEIEQCLIGNIFPEKQIVGWIEKDDYPHHEEYWELGIKIDDDLDELLEERKVCEVLHCDKLFGWTYWEQDTRYPLDSISHKNMNHIFQVISYDNLDYSFGDDGVFNLFYNNEENFDLDHAFACG